MNLSGIKATLREKGFKPHYVLKICLLAAVILSFAMALKSDYNRHPDEHNHFAAVRYYYNHFLPPVIDDPAIRDSYSGYGVSYLNYQWVEYLVSGQISGAILFFISDEVVAVRFSVIFLFLVLTAWFLYRSRKNSEEFIPACFLLVTSQVWYVFSYANNDAFALFISMLAACQLAYPKSWLNEFLASDKFFENLRGGLWFGSLLGLIAICKPNYWPFLIFTALWVIYKFGLFKIRLIKKYALMMTVTVSILAFRCGMDIYVNGETNFAGVSYLSKFFGVLEKTGKLLELQEQVAVYKCKPSTFENDPENSDPSMQLMKKGVPLSSLFSEMRWHEITFGSFFAGYGYLDLWPNRKFYERVAVLSFLFIGYLFYVITISNNRGALTEMALVSLGIFLTVAISVGLSWIYAFQPQGRYLFPILPMMGVLIYSNRRLFNNVAMNLCFFIYFLLSFAAFTTIALVYINAPYIISK